MPQEVGLVFTYGNGTASDPGAGYRARRSAAAYLGGDHLEEPAELAFYCSKCAEREFHGDS